jgi:hypothetical protein
MLVGSYGRKKSLHISLEKKCEFVLKIGSKHVLRVFGSKKMSHPRNTVCEPYILKVLTPRTKKTRKH